MDNVKIFNCLIALFSPACILIARLFTCMSWATGTQNTMSVKSRIILQEHRVSVVQDQGNTVSAQSRTTGTHCQRSPRLWGHSVSVVQDYGDTVSAQSRTTGTPCQRSPRLWGHSFSVVQNYGRTMSAQSRITGAPCKRIPEIRQHHVSVVQNYGNTV